MNRAEFIKLCVSIGYCTKKRAEEYAKDRTEFSEEDFVEVYRLQERMDYLEHREASVDPVRGRCTKRYKNNDSGGYYG